MVTISDWDVFFDRNEISPKQKKLLIDYIIKLTSENYPVIFEFEHLAKLTGFSSDTLSDLTADTSKSYRIFTIPKKRGGERTISSPYPALASCQKWILDHILSGIDLGPYSYAFRSDRSIIDNAQAHLGNDELLKLDIVNFFGSIEIERIISVFKNVGYTNSVSYHLASICCLENCLPQGSCTSPSLSNIISKRMDRRISALTIKMKLVYTRYADDITISGGEIPKNLISYIKNIIEEEGFSINKSKTVLKKVGQKKIITGLCITGNKVRAPKVYRRKFRQDSYFLLKYGIENYNGSQGRFDPLYVHRLIGKANFILMVEPDYKYALEVLPKLKKLLPTTS